jgi:hypothetical protein
MDAGGDEPVAIGDLDENYTGNTNGMIREACGSSPSSWNGLPASEVATLAATAAKAMRDDPDRFDAMNPANGWGSRATLVPVLEKIAEGCRAAPKATVRVT